MELGVNVVNDELNERIQDFISAFELVFDIDWNYTKSRMVDETYISEQGTFLNPFPGEHFTGGKGDNWANRSSLLTAYREFKAFTTIEEMYNLDAEPWK